jgi:hypothetical protein
MWPQVPTAVDIVDIAARWYHMLAGQQHHFTCPSTLLPTITHTQLLPATPSRARLSPTTLTSSHPHPITHTHAGPGGALHAARHPPGWLCGVCR